MWGFDENILKSLRQTGSLFVIILGIFLRGCKQSNLSSSIKEQK